MFKSSAYLFMLTAVGAFVVLAAMAIPQVFTADMGEDLRDDLSRTREMALDQYRLRSWEQVTAAQTAASPELADAVSPKPPEPEPEPEPVRRFPRRLPPEPEPEPQAPEPDKGAIQKLAANMARSLRQDLVLVLDEEGKVLGSNNEESPAAEGDDLSGLPAVQEALKGFSRDGIWITKPGEVVFTLGVSPLTAVRDGKQTLVGAVLLGKQLDGSFTAQVAQQLNPTDHHNYTIGLALVHSGRSFASSMINEHQDRVVTLAKKVAGPNALPTEGDKGLFETSDQSSLSGTNNVIGTFVTALNDSAEGSQIGVVALAVRPKAITDLRELVPMAFALENSLALENAGVVGGIAFALFLLGLLLLTSEFSRPGRLLERRLRDLKQDVERTEFKTDKLRGVYRDVGIEVQQVLTVLRKRLQHEREARHSAEEALASSVGAAPTLFANPEEPAPIDRRSSIELPPVAAPAAEPDTVVNPEAMAQAPEAADRAAPTARSSSNWRRPRVPLASSEAGMASGNPLPLNRSSNNLLKPLSDDQVTTIATIPPELRDVEPGRVPATGLSPDELPSGDEGDEGGDEDYTLDMPRDELATLFRTLSAESETETKAAAAPSRSPVVEPSYGLDEPLGGSHTSHDAPTQNVFDNISERGWTNIALPALQESANTASQQERPVAPYAARPSGGDPLSPQSLLETLKKRANAPSSRPIRAKTSSSSGRPAVVEESTQVKRVDPADLRRSAEHAIMASRLESNSGIHKLSAVEQQELRELYQKFVDTKKSCGESVEGLTLKRFAKRVIANRRKLIQQYNCRTVRFQVYVKNGKAALKATPLK